MNDKLARIDEKLDRGALAAVPFNRSSIAISTMGEAMEMAKLMSLSRQAVRAPFRGEPGICLALVIQAHEWGLNPYAAASKAYVVNDQIAWESQLIHAVIESRAPLKGRLRCAYTGTGVERKCIVSGTFTDGEVREYESPMIKDIVVKNSPLWRNDPDQQQWYYSSRAWCRKWCANVLLGIYAPDELDFSRGAKDVAQNQTVDFNPLGSADPIEENIKIVEHEEEAALRAQDEAWRKAEVEAEAEAASKAIADDIAKKQAEQRATAMVKEAKDRADWLMNQTVADEQQNRSISSGEEREDAPWPDQEPSGARGKASSTPKATEATKAATKAESAQAASARGSRTSFTREMDPHDLTAMKPGISNNDPVPPLREPPQTPGGYYQEAMAYIANATVEGTLANYWKGQRSARLAAGMTAKEMQNLTDTYWAKHIALSEGE